MTHPFTPTYISMSKASEEIQAMRLDEDAYQLGDWFLGDYGPELLDRSTLGTGESPPWLPRLDQLLGMAFDKTSPTYAAQLHGLADDLSDGADWYETLLMVIMGKCGKTWRDGQWVKG